MALIRKERTHAVSQEPARVMDGFTMVGLAFAAVSFLMAISSSMRINQLHTHFGLRRKK